MSNVIKNRYDFIYFFDVKDGNPNGDPDQANLPRADAENQEGIVTDVCIKRKVRNYVQIKYNLKLPNDIFIRQRSVNEDDSYLNKVIEKAEGESASDKRVNMCKQYFDIRTFGAVLSTGKDDKESKESSSGKKDTEEKSKKKGKKVKGAGTVRGPVQFTFSRSEDRIYQAEHSITRCCVTTEKEKNEQEKKDREHASTFGRKSTVPYGLYQMHGFISAVDAVKTGFSDEDLELLWEALLNAFEHDRAAARGEMNPRKLIVFKHSSHLGNARSGELFDCVTVKKNTDLPRQFTDYAIKIDSKRIPKGVELIEKL